MHELLTVPCKVNARTDSGMGPLHLVAAKGYDAIAKDLLGAGVAPDMQDKVSKDDMLYEGVCVYTRSYHVIWHFIPSTSGLPCMPLVHMLWCLVMIFVLFLKEIIYFLMRL